MPGQPLPRAAFPPGTMGRAGNIRHGCGRGLGFLFGKDAPLLWALALLLCAALLTPLGAAAGERVRVALQWQPQSQFAGYYVALEKGYYAAAGLDVELVHAGVGRTSQTLLAQGEVHAAGMLLLDALRLRPPPVQLLQLVQHSQLMLMAWKDMGVHAPRDLAGQRVAMWEGGFSLALDAFLAQHGVTVRKVPQYSSIELFLRRGVAAAAAMEYSELDRVYLAGVDLDQLTLFRMRDEGLDVPEDGLFADRAWAARHPQAALQLAQATLQGWRHAQAHVEETLDIVLARAKAADVTSNRAHERWMLQTVLRSIFGDEPQAPAGRLDQAAYARAVHVLRSIGAVQAAPDWADLQLEGGRP